jgi:hypothetical protein
MNLRVDASHQDSLHREHKLSLYRERVVDDVELLKEIEKVKKNCLLFFTFIKQHAGSGLISRN